MEIKSEILENLSKKDELYQFRVGDMSVEMAYSKNQKSFNECMLAILKQKVKIG